MGNQEDEIKKDLEKNQGKETKRTSPTRPRKKMPTSEMAPSENLQPGSNSSSTNVSPPSTPETIPAALELSMLTNELRQILSNKVTANQRIAAMKSTDYGVIPSLAYLQITNIKLFEENSTLLETILEEKTDPQLKKYVKSLALCFQKPLQDDIITAFDRLEGGALREQIKIFQTNLRVAVEANATLYQQTTTPQTQLTQLQYVQRNLFVSPTSMSHHSTHAAASSFPAFQTTLRSTSSTNTNVVHSNTANESLFHIAKHLKTAVSTHNQAYSATPKPNSLGTPVNWSVTSERNAKLVISSGAAEIGHVEKNPNDNSIAYKFSAAITFDTADIVLRASTDPTLMLSSTSKDDILSILRAANTPPNNEGNHKKTITLADNAKDVLKKAQNERGIPQEMQEIVRVKLEESNRHRSAP